MKRQMSLVLLVVMLFSSAVANAAQTVDTMFFEYNESTHELTVRTSKLGTGVYPFFDVTQNDFSEALFKSGKENGYIDGTMLDGACWKPSDAQTLRGLDRFDSLQCTNLVVLRDERGKDRNQSPKFKIVVSIIRTPEVVAAPDGEAAGGNTSNNSLLSKNLLPIAIAGVVVIIVVVLLVVRARKKKSQEEATKPHTKTKSLEVVEVVKNDQLKGLDFIKTNPLSYYHIDLQKDFSDTMVHNIYIHHTVVKKMYDFFKLSLESGEVTNETGCYFVGCWEYDKKAANSQADNDNPTYNISLEEIVEPGDDLQPGEFSFNFGLKIGVKLNAAIEKLSKSTGRDYVHTVWMHSHPGLGLFLSSHDLLVQRQLAYADAKNRLVAFVVDTNTPNLDLAIFSAKADGTMNNKEEIRHLYSLEDLYLWSRKAHAGGSETHTALEENVTPPVDLDNYHALQVNHQGNARTLNVYLGSSVINAIDDILYDNEGKHRVAGYLVGNQQNPGSSIVVAECHPLEEGKMPPDDALGVFIVDDTKDDATLKARYLANSKALCAFIGRGGDELIILTRDNAQSQFPPISQAATCSMKPMKEWLRRRRIYK